ncbi:hypothetical protein BST61_g7208 [Cercospora zeina]
MHLLYFVMLLMPLSVLAHLRPRTIPPKYGTSRHPRTKKIKAKSTLSAKIGPRHQDCEYWHSFPEIKAWGGIHGIIRNARSIVDLAVSVRNGTTTEIGLLGPEELATLELRYFGELDARRKKYVDRSLRKLQKAWDRTTYVCKSVECNLPGFGGWVDMIDWAPIVNICPWWWYGSCTWQEVIEQHNRFESDWGNVREALLIHEMMHLRIVGAPGRIVDLHDKMYCPPGRGNNCMVYGPVMAQGAVHNGFDTTKKRG